MKKTAALGLTALLFGLAAAHAQTETVLHNFTIFPDGATPFGTLAIDSSGNLFGTTFQGGTNNIGTVFEYSASGAYTVLHSFTADGADGSGPYSGVTIDAAGNLYGTTSTGGTFGLGTIYKLTPSGQETVLHSFAGASDGSAPYSGVTLDAAGNLYGTTYKGGTANVGVVYRIASSGIETILHSFTGGADGANPYAGLAIDPAGNLYGTTFAGGQNNEGLIFKMSPTGLETVLYNGGAPKTGVTLDAEGNLYGALGYDVYKLTASGQYTVIAQVNIKTYGDYVSPITLARDTAGNLYGTTNAAHQQDITYAPHGAAFKVSPAGEVTLLCLFPGESAEDAPESGTFSNLGVVLDGEGNVYGATSNAGVAGAIYKVDPALTTIQLHNFTGAPGGNSPRGLIAFSNGELYGANDLGGVWNEGVIYRMNSSGKETVLYSFTGGDDGATPEGAPVMDAQGNLYGSTFSGGTWNEGVIFKLSPSGQETVLYTFGAGVNYDCPDGCSPGGVAMDAVGNLYGTAFGGGTIGNGGVFKVSPSGQETMLYNFGAPGDGYIPNGAVVLDPEGNVYGTTSSGGAFGYGTVFQVSPEGQETILYAFPGGSEGGYPTIGPVMDAAGNLYGATGFEGSDGVLFQLNPSHNYSVLHTFTGGADGGSPGGLALDAHGNLFGSSSVGGVTGYGVVFEYTSKGQFETLYNFPSPGDAGGASIAVSPSGIIYGTGYVGAHNGGLVYKLTR